MLRQISVNFRRHLVRFKQPRILAQQLGGGVARRREESRVGIFDVPSRVGDQHQRGGLGHDLRQFAPFRFRQLPRGDVLDNAHFPQRSSGGIALRVRALKDPARLPIAPLDAVFHLGGRAERGVFPARLPHPLPVLRMDGFGKGLQLPVKLPRCETKEAAGFGGPTELAVGFRIHDPSANLAKSLGGFPELMTLLQRRFRVFLGGDVRQDQPADTPLRRTVGDHEHRPDGLVGDREPEFRGLRRLPHHRAAQKRGKDRAVREGDEDGKAAAQQARALLPQQTGGGEIEAGNGAVRLQG